MKVTFEVSMKGEAAKAEGFIQQVSNHLIDYINQNNFTVESINRDISFTEEEQQLMQQLNTPQTATEPQIIQDMPMQVAQEKLKKLKEFYKIVTKKEKWSGLVLEGKNVVYTGKPFDLPNDAKADADKAKNALLLKDKEKNFTTEVKQA